MHNTRTLPSAWRPVAVAAAASIALLAGCAAPARIDQMQVSSPMPVRTAVEKSPLKAEVAVREVTGGRETNPLWVSNVSSSDFERAIEASLRDAGLAAANKQAGKYQLVADLVKLDQPFIGASMTVTATVRYRLIERASSKTVADQTIAVPFTAAWNAAFMGVERLKLANEGAVRSNIEKLIEFLVGLKVSDLTVANR
jgi:hypothetical protein